jgi:outer membrane receptor protein involved in Fe transport
MKHSLACLRISAIALGAMALTAGLRAQTAPAAPTKNPGEVVELSEFQVSDKSPNGYIASETMTGSRVNTKIADLPYSIVNLTQEFFSDYSISILDENMTLIGGLTGISIGGGFTLRGFSATSQMKDGFYRLGRYGMSNMDRIEIIRGPNAAIYGRSSPGGMINFISLQPKKQNLQEIRTEFGRYSQGVGELYAQGSLTESGKTYFVLDLAQRGRFYPDEQGRIRNGEMFGAIQHDFDDNAHLKLSAEYFLQIQHSPPPSAPIVSQARAATPDNTATSTVVGYDVALASVNPYGPNSELNRGSTTYTATYDKQFNPVWSTRVAGYYFRARRWDYNQNTGWGGITLPLTGTTVTSTRGALPSRGEIMEDGGGFQGDLVAHYFAANNQIENKTLFTVDLNDYYRWDPTWEYGTNSDPDVVAWTAATSGRVVNLASPDGSLNYVPTASVTYFPKMYTASNLALFAPGGNDISGGTSLNGGTLTRRRTISLGGNIRQQAILLQGRLIAYAGLRIDNVKFSQRDYTVAFASVGFTFPAGQGGVGQPGSSVVRRFIHQRKPNLGFNYKLTPNVAVYGSYSEAYFVDQTSRPAVIAASTYAPFTAKGIDYGFKGNYFDQRLNFTLGGFFTHQYNVLVTDRVETPPGSGSFVDTSRQDGNQLVRGWETDVSYVVSNAVTLGGSFARIDSKYTFLGSAFPEVVGRSVNGVTPENGSAYVKYNFNDGPLKGLYFNVLANYVSSTPTQAPNAGDTTVTKNGITTVTAHTDAWKLRLPSYTVWTFAAHYKLPRLNRMWDQSVGLTLYNAFDKAYLKTNAQAGDRRSIIVSYTLTHAGSH